MNQSFRPYAETEELLRFEPGVARPDIMVKNTNKLTIWWGLVIGIVILAASLTSVNAQPSSTPESRTKEFYSWYLKAMVKGKDPTKDKTVTKSYLSLRFSRRYYSKAGQNAAADAFISSQEWNDAWADNIDVGEAVYLTDNTAALHVKLSSPPHQFVMRLQVRLVKEGGKWKIDRVAGLFD